MKAIFSVSLFLIAFSSCHTTPKPLASCDTVIVAYIQNNQWRFNTAIVSQKIDRKWVGDSGLDAKMDVVRQIRLQLPPVKADSIIDTLKHTYRITPRYDIPLIDSFNHYIHILDTIHSH